jgi:WD40 repeat protein
MKKILYTFFIILITLTAKAQFYNGLEMSFGKNRVQYKPYNWRYLHYNKFDIYFYESGTNLAKFTAENIDGIMAEMKFFFGVIIDEPIIFVVYDKLSDFRQSNVGLETGDVDFNIGGKEQITDNKVFIFYEGDHEKLLQQLKFVIAKIYISKIIYGTAFTDKLASTTLLNVPTWFEDGLASYLSKPYNIEVFNKTKDLIQTSKRVNFNHLTENQATFIGHSFWYYIADEYGEDVISNILYFSKVSKSIKNSINFVLGIQLNILTLQWREYYISNLDIENDVKLPDESAELKITKKNRVYQEFKVSPDGENIAYVENRQGKYKLFVYNLKTEKKVKLYQEGQRIQQIEDYSYPVVAWNQSGKVLGFTTEKDGQAYLWTYNFDKQELANRLLPNVGKINDFSFSPNGYLIAFSGVSNGYTDLFMFNLIAGNFQRLTNDLPDDLYPRFDQTSTKIIFSSNRTTDTLKKVMYYQDNQKINNNFDLFIYNINSKEKILTRLTSTSYSNENQVISLPNDKYFYLSDSLGFINRYALSFDSAISYIDTIIHYKNIIKNWQVSDYSQNIIQHNLQKNTLGEIIFNNNKYRLYKTSVSTLDIPKLDYENTYNKLKQKEVKNQEKLQQKKLDFLVQQKVAKKLIDSLTPFFEKFINSPDEAIIDYNNYVFEIEKDTLFKKYYEEKNKKDSNEIEFFPKALVYHQTFYQDEIKSSLDFSSFNQSYQPFTGTAFYFSPFANIFTTLGATELFSDYKLLAGIRWGFDGSMAYLFSIENLKKRLDKQVIFHRQVSRQNFIGIYYFPDSITNTKTNELLFIFRYPFNQVASIKWTLLGKYDRIVYKSIDYTQLIKQDKYKIYAGAKVEYIFDNTRNIALNLCEGIKFKTFAEFYQQAEGQYDYTTVFGLDFRYYKNIFRNIIFAHRTAFSTSLGSGKVLYYLGGVDSWYNLTMNDDNYFDKSVNINQSETYFFQAVATNMRGFNQNIRNGNSFFVLNNELRVPIIRMLANYPLNSEFWNNFQIIGFFDIGSAWSGLTPYSEQNSYNTIIIENDPITVMVEVNRPPLVYGYGWGVRSKLLGYFFRLDWAWGIEGSYKYPQKFYFSLSFDF